MSKIKESDSSESISKKLPYHHIDHWLWTKCPKSKKAIPQNRFPRNYLTTISIPGFGCYLLLCVLLSKSCRVWHLSSTQTFAVAAKSFLHLSPRLAMQQISLYSQKVDFPNGIFPWREKLFQVRGESEKQEYCYYSRTPQ